MASMQGDTRLDALSFGEAHDNVWTTYATAIGLSAPQCAAYTADVAAAREKYDEMIVARNAAKAATQEWYDAADTMKVNAASLIAVIKGHAEVSANPTLVYTRAQIPPPAIPTPAGPPVDCTELTATLTNSGNVQLNWKGSLAKGQFFSIWRRLTGESAWTQLGSIAAKAYLDTLVPEAITGAQYQVKAHRGTAVSEGCEPVGIIFGTVALAA